MLLLKGSLIHSQSQSHKWKSLRTQREIGWPSMEERKLVFRLVVFVNVQATLGKEERRV